MWSNWQDARLLLGKLVVRVHPPQHISNRRSMNELALFAGGGGGILGGNLLGWRTVCAVEINAYARRILLARQRDGILPRFPIWDDIRTFDAMPWGGHIDVISAGFPCTPFSCVGKREAGDSDKNLWPETIRVIREVRPKHLLLENVPGLLFQSHGYMHTILGQLAESGYDCRWDCIPASALGANHQRDRLWIVAHHNDAQLRVQPRGSGGESRQEEVLSSGNGSTPWGLTQPEFCRTHDGMAGRMDTDRLKALGNGQVPAVVRFAWRHLS